MTMIVDDDVCSGGCGDDNYEYDGYNFDDNGDRYVALQIYYGKIRRYSCLANSLCCLQK